MPPAICIAVMAKAPVPGRAKTRLVPALGAAQAAAMSAAFLRDVTENILAAGARAPVQGAVAYAPAGQEGLFEGHVAPGTMFFLADGAPDMPAGVEGFGRCLLHAVNTMLQKGFAGAVVLNSDSPTLPTALLVQCARLLAAPGERAVLGPAADGGYYLLGLKAAHPELFMDIAWSTANVAAQTRARATKMGLPLVELPEWYDVDDAASLDRLLGECATPPRVDGLVPYAAPATAACIARLGLDKVWPA